LWAVVDEAALYEQIGGPAVMREQIDFLAQVAELPHVHIQILPSGAAGQVGIGNSFSMLRLRMTGLSDVVYLEHIGSALFLEHPDDLDPYKIAMTRLSIAAGKAHETAEKLRNARDRHRQSPRQAARPHALTDTSSPHARQQAQRSGQHPGKGDDGADGRVVR
jgi:hypothetical protein